MEHLKDLNPQQKEAVTYTEGPLLILAGAGAGKTRVITHRILHLIQSGVAPESILAVTFTNKAAKEMSERIQTLLRTDKTLNRPAALAGLPYTATFHALGVDILRTHFRTLGISKYFAIFDRGDSLRAIRTAIKDAGYDPGQFEPRKILGSISRLKGDGLSFPEFETRELTYYESVVCDIWKEYEKTLREEKAFDFDDLLLQSVLLLRRHKNVREYYHNIWAYIHIDEYQDTNKVQNEMARLLTGKDNNICVVGDVDQTIYTWRGAHIQNILDFAKEYPNTKTVLLEENYRSTKTIITASNRIIEKNQNRQEKNLFTNNTEGEKITVFGAYGEIDEAYYITNKVRELIASGININEIAVLYRANFQSRMLEEAFLNENIPYQVLGVRFFDRKEIKDILSFIRLAQNPDSITDLKRVVNVPPRGIGKVTLLRMVERKTNECSPAIQKKISDFWKIISNIKDVLSKEIPSDAIKNIIKITGIEEHLLSGNDEDHERLENIRELATLARKYDRTKTGIEKLLTDAALATDQDTLSHPKDGVKLMTVHAAKGLEFDVVFITGLEEGLFPHEGGEQKIDDEEERRLFYVALTRARKKVFLTYTSLRTIFGSEQVNIPSQFISDIDEELMDVEDESIQPREKTIYLDLDEL